jgi:hypothetical protein
MANDLLTNPGPPDLNVGYGNADAAAYYGMQQEMLRRAALARQAQQDELERQLKLQEIAASKENVATSRVQREAAAATNTERANKLGLEQATLGLTPGSNLSPDQSAAILRFGGKGLVKKTPAMTEGVPTQFAEPPNAAAAPEVTQTPEQTTFAGTADQQLLQQHRDYAQKIVDGLNAKKAAGDELSPIEQEQLYEGNAILMTGKSATAPAATIVPKTASEKDQTRFLNIRSAQVNKKPVSPDDAAWADEYEKQHPSESTKQAHAVVRLEIGQTGANARQDSAQLASTKSAFRRDISQEDAKLGPDLERVDRAQKVLSSPNFLADAIAAPEVLQIMAGGMGSGLRMTDAELNRVNNAQTKLDQLKGELAKYGLGTPVTIQARMREQMRVLVDTVAKARARKAKLMEETLRRIDDADTMSDVDKLHADYMGARNGGAENMPSTKKNKTYNPATGKVE